MPVMRRPRLAVWKFASCDGCQLSLLDCEEELPAVAGAVKIAHFPEGFRDVVRGPYDISLVEGSITTPNDEERIQRVRRASRTVIAIGACACAGGIQALRNFGDVEEFIRLVYARPGTIRALAKSTPISEHIRVDAELRGCPVNKRQLLDVIVALLHGRKPFLPSYSVCMECKMRGNTCVTVARGIPCLGPVDPGGMRRAMPLLRPGMLRMLWAQGNPQHRFAEPLVEACAGNE